MIIDEKVLKELYGIADNAKSIEDLQAISTLLKSGCNFAGNNVGNNSVELEASTVKGEYDLDNSIENILKSFGISSGIKGKGFLTSAIKLGVEDEKDLYRNNITKQLYPTIASQYQTTPSKVERAIRHAIQRKWHLVDNNLISKVFGMVDSMTNGEFIFGVVDYIKLEQKNHNKAYQR